MALTYIQKTVHPTPITLHESNGVAYFTFPLLEQTRMVRHAFSTRLGGASKGYFSTMNFSLTRGDNRDDVLENYRKMARRPEVWFRRLRSDPDLLSRLKTEILKLS